MKPFLLISKFLAVSWIFLWIWPSFISHPRYYLFIFYRIIKVYLCFFPLMINMAGLPLICEFVMFVVTSSFKETHSTLPLINSHRTSWNAGISKFLFMLQFPPLKVFFINYKCENVPSTAFKNISARD